MKHNFLLIFILFGLFQYSCSQNLVLQDNKLDAELKKMISDKDLRNAGISFFAIDITTGDTISEYNPDLALAPASTLKLLTTATALEIFGADFRFKTKIKYTGRIDTVKKILFGDIIIEGGGDPTLGSKYFKKTMSHAFLDNWSAAIKNAGIDSITGSIIGDARIYSYDIVPPSWTWENMGNYFGAGACGLSIYDNFYTLFFKTSSSAGGKTKILKIEPEIPGLVFKNNVKSYSGRSDLSYIFGAPYSYQRYINGKLPRNKAEYKVKGSLPDPAYTTVCELEKKLKLDSIKIGKPATTIRLNPELESIDKSKQELLYTSLSPTLFEIIKSTNFISVNLFAEHLLNHIGYKKIKQGRTQPAANFIEAFWQERGMDIGGMAINDGSGLSRYNTITVRQMVFMLQYMKKKSKNADIFYNTMAIVGKEGTVKKLCKGSAAQNNMRAKSGTIRNVKCYAGYVKTASGRELAFSIMINNFNCKSSEAKKKIEKIFIAMADLDI